MGLDMYLHLRLEGQEEPVESIYWRKANSIHGWFIDNCANGVDESCREIEVHPEQLGKLISDCQVALNAYNNGDKDAAAKVMAPREGFFFGATEIDQWWAEDLAQTISDVQEAITTAAETPGQAQFTYWAWW